MLIVIGNKKIYKASLLLSFKSLQFNQESGMCINNYSRRHYMLGHEGGKTTRIQWMKL